MKRTLLGRHGLLVLSTLACCGTACAPAGERESTLGEPVGDQEAALLSFECDGALSRLRPMWYENLELSITPYICEKDGELYDHKLDPAGNEWSWDALRLAEREAFRSKHHRLAPGLRERMDKEGEVTPILADVWFVTRLEDDEKVPPKHVLLEMDPVERDAIFEQHATSIAERGREVAELLGEVAPELSVLEYSPAFSGGGPLLQVMASAPELRTVGDLDGIIFVGLGARLDEDRPASEVWYDVGRFGLAVAYGIDGDGVKVADILGSPGVYDTTYLGLASGSCDPPQGSTYLCYCPAPAPTVSGAGHLQHTMSVIKNTWSTLRGGAARHATMLAGNGSSTCVSASKMLENVVPWATGQGASVINRSATHLIEWSRYLDYVATVSPYPTIMAAAGNDAGTVGSHLRNGPVVGAADDHGSTNRTQLAMAWFSNWQNISGNWELPHLVAPGVDIDVVSNAQRYPFWAFVNHDADGTSYATPQVSGAVAALQEYEPIMKYWPELALPVLLVSAFTPGAPAGPDGNTFVLDDGVDDRDGAGALDVWGALQAANVPSGAARAGMSAWVTSASQWPLGFYPQVWNAEVYPGDYLRVAAVMFNHPTCGSPPDQNNCSSDGYPRFGLKVSRPGTSQWSMSFDNNYQYVVLQNTTGSTQLYEIRLYMVDWQGLTSDSFGVAWSSW